MLIIHASIKKIAPVDLGKCFKTNRSSQDVGIKISCTRVLICRLESPATLSGAAHPAVRADALEHVARPVLHREVNLDRLAHSSQVETDSKDIYNSLSRRVRDKALSKNAALLQADEAKVTTGKRRNTAIRVSCVLIASLKRHIFSFLKQE